MYYGGLGAEPPAKKMGYIVGKNGKSYIKSYIDLCKMGIKNQKFSLIRGGLFNYFFEISKFSLIRGGLFS